MPNMSDNPTQTISRDVGHIPGQLGKIMAATQGEYRYVYGWRIDLQETVVKFLPNLNDYTTINKNA